MAQVPVSPDRSASFFTKFPPLEDASSAKTGVAKAMNNKNAAIFFIIPSLIVESLYHSAADPPSCVARRLSKVVFFFMKDHGLAGDVVLALGEI